MVYGQNRYSSLDGLMFSIAVMLWLIAELRLVKAVEIFEVAMLMELMRYGVASLIEELRHSEIIRNV